MKKRISYIMPLAITIFAFGCKSGNKEKGNDFRFDAIVPVITPVSNYVLLGDKYKAEIGLRAYSTTMPLEMKIDSNPNQGYSYNNGTFHYEIIPDKEGEYKLHGEVRIPGSDKGYSFEASYVVAKPTALIVPSEFVLYRGKENKLDISVPGFPSDKLSVLATNCKLSGKDGKYVVVPGKENKVTITVISYLNNQGQKIGEYDYPVADK